MPKLRKKIFHPIGPVRRPTEEELKEFDEKLKILCETGSVCTNYPSESCRTNDAIDSIRRGNFISIDYSGDLPYEEFYDRLMKGECDAKRMES